MPQYRTADSPFDLSAYSPVYLYRLKCRLWERMTKGDGYQPFGYDRRTLLITEPGFMAAIDAVNLYGMRCLHS